MNYAFYIMNYYDIVAQSSESTVVAEYTPDYNKHLKHQSEAELEKDFIKRLEKQGYEHISIKREEELIANLRAQLEKLNDFTFSDKEWEQFYTKVISNNNEGMLEKTKKIQEEYIQILNRDDGSTKNIKLIEKKNILKNHLQVVNQYEESQGKRETRYDVTILVNGLPLIHIELKRRGVKIREAFNQINRYIRESFWAGSALFEYIQIFVISNGTKTKYYSNTTRSQHIKEAHKNLTKKKSKTSNSFEFTSFWADANNKTIPDIIDFTKTFFAKHTIINILTRYCVFTSENLLLVMRPYQIAATERILNIIELSTNHKMVGKIDAGGYIWHTTGSGKTLTSFKTAQLATSLPYIDKVLFVVDRKDLDYQTMKEYDRFEKGAANSNVSTAVLQKQLEDDNTKIIITTIQKLDKFIGKNKEHAVYKKHLAIIFDECHRSQFGDMHVKIVKAFKKYHLFGFTGTPIFAKNAGKGKYVNLRTTEQAFGAVLHKYTIVDAIHDNNVLPFRIDFINTIKQPEDIQDKKVKAIDKEAALSDPRRIEEVVSYILKHFDQKTYRNQQGSKYDYRRIVNIQKMASSKNNTVTEKKETVRVNGFNSIFAVASIPMAIQYYAEFKTQLAASNTPLRIATIFSFNPNEEDPDDFYLDEEFETDNLDASSRDFLDSAIKDYNKSFGTNYDTSGDKFQNYYKDVSLRMKNREIDLLIVVNMFLTGFDATTLNTLWVDKNLKQHGLIQGFSRTNRILNSIKRFGNIVCFRNLEEETNKALSLFGNKNAGGIVLLKSYEDYINGYTDDKDIYVPGYKALIERLLTEFPLGQDIIGEEAKKKFIQLFGAILRIRNILVSFDEFSEDTSISDGELQDYQSIYLDLRDEFTKGCESEKEIINDDIVFEIELIKQIEIGIDYILMLVAKYHDSNCQDTEILGAIDKAINANPELRSKKELIKNFINQINAKTADLAKDWQGYIAKQKEAELTNIIAEESLKVDETKRLIDNAFRDGSLKTTGTDIDAILPPLSRFSSGSTGTNRAEKKQTVIAKLVSFFEKFSGV